MCRPGARLRNSGFEDVLLTGLARDGGLYVPARWPQFSARDLRSLRGKSYEEVAFAVITPFIGGRRSRGRAEGA